MAVKPALIFGGIAAALTIGTAGWFANEWRVCKGLEDDYISSVKSYTRQIETGALVSSVTGAQFKGDRELQDLSLEIQERQLERIYERCGSNAGNAASDGAYEVLQESTKTILMIP
jgi:hypothetical protein